MVHFLRYEEDAPTFYYLTDGVKLTVTFILYLSDITKDYNFLMIDCNSRSYYGVHFDKDKIEVDEFIEKIQLQGNAQKDSTYEAVQVFLME